MGGGRAVDWAAGRQGRCIGLHAGTDDLMRVGEGAGQDLGEARDEEVIDVGQAGGVGVDFGGRSIVVVVVVGGGAEEFSGGSFGLKLFISDKVDGAMTDTGQGGDEAAEVATPTFMARNGAQTEEHGRVGSLAMGRGGEHTGLDDPYWIG